jgi:integrase
MGRPRTKHRDMPPGCRQIAGRWYVEATNRHVAKTIAEMTGGKKSMPLAPKGKPAPTDKRAAREYYVHVFVRPLDQFAEAEAGTVSELVALARIDLLPKYGTDKGRKQAGRYLDRIDEVFGERLYARNNTDASTGRYLRKLDVQRFLYQQTEHPVAANRMVQVMSRMFSMAETLWGRSEYNPCDGVERNQELPREQQPDADEFARVYALAPEWLQCAMLIARDYARRRGEIMGLTVADILPEHLRFSRGKARNGRTPKVILIEWDDGLRAIVARLLAHKQRMEDRNGVRSTRLLVNEDGVPVSERGWNSAWIRTTNKAGVNRAGFHFHDLRSVTPSGMSVAEAQHLLAHDSQQSTKVYRRGPHVIRAEFRKSSEKAPNSEKVVGSK